MALATNVVWVTVLMGILARVERRVPGARPPHEPERITANLALGASTFAANAATTALAVGLAPTARPSLARVALAIVLLDFLYGYLAHRTMHASALLWRVHRVHHADPFVDVTTTYRTHPLEALWRSAFVLVAVPFGIPAQAIVLHRVLAAVGGLTEHANVRIRPAIDRALSWVVVTPDMHKVHHSRLPAETNSNYGNLLALFDAWLGTRTPNARARGVRYGLDEVDPARTCAIGPLLALRLDRPDGALVVEPHAGELA